MVDLRLKVTRATVRPCSTKLVMVELTDASEADLLVHVDIKRVIKYYGPQDLLTAIGEDRIVEYLELIHSDEEG